MRLRLALVGQSMTGITMYRFNRFSMSRKQAGFSLIELMVTLVVLGVVMSAALPSFKSQMSRSDADALNDDLQSALQLARTEAIKRSGYVSLCASKDGASCSGDTNGWTDGFIVVVDYPLTEDAEPLLTNSANPTATILRVWQKQSDKTVLKIRDTSDTAAKPVPLGAARAFIRFTKLGTLTEKINSAKGIVINSKMKAKVKEPDTSSNCEPRSARQYTVGLVGMVRLVNETCW